MAKICLLYSFNCALLIWEICKVSDHKFLQLAKFQIALCCKVYSLATGVLKSNVADCHSLHNFWIVIDCS